MVGCRLETPEDIIPKSGIVVLAKMTAPSSLSRAAAGASASEIVWGVAAVPIWYGSPAVAMFSLTVTGIPSSKPRGSLFA